MKRITKQIYKKIKQYKTIIIARHVGPDPDALGSQLGLKEMILFTFPEKTVLAVGAPASKFKFMGLLDKLEEEILEQALLIVVDTPDQKRIDGININHFKETIKIDHHPFLEEYATIEWIDETASSAAQMIIELGLRTPLKINQKAAENLFIGVVADTNRFLYNYTSVRTMTLIRDLVFKYNLKMPLLYEQLYERDLNEIRLQGFIATNMIVTEAGVGYVILTDAIIKEYNVDAGSAGNLVNSFNYIKQILVWLTISEDVKQQTIRVNIRSRGPIINKIAEEHHGGGHIYASGARLQSFAEAEVLISKLNELCKTYKLEQLQKKE